MSRGRKAIELNKGDFQAAITSLENLHKPTNRSQLWQIVAGSDWANMQKPRPLTAQVAMLKAKELGLTIQTPMGKRGEGLVRSNGPARKRISLDVIENVGKGVPVRFQKSLVKLASGSLKAAIKLKCLECSAWEMKEVRDCNVNSCSLYPVRPYKNQN